MKKFYSIVTAVMAAAVCFTLPVYAAVMDVSGDYEVRGFSISNTDYNNTDNNWLDARFRLMTTVKQGITTGVVQIDFLGNNTMTNGSNGRLVLGNEFGNTWNLLGVRQAYLSMAMPHHTLIAGRYNFKLGNGIVFNNTSDLVATVFQAGPVNFFVAYTLMGEDDDASPSLANPPAADGDATGFVVNAALKGMGWDWDIFLAQHHFNLVSADNKLQTIGVTGNGMVGPVKVMGELDLFSGDKTSSVGYEGTNLLLGGSLPVSFGDVNAALIYASGQSGTTDENVNSIDGHGDFRASNVLIRDDFNNFDGLSSIGDLNPGAGLGLQAIKLAVMLKPFEMMMATHTPEIGLVFANTSEDDGSGNSDLGTELFVNTNCVMDKNLSSNLGIAFVSAGDVLGTEDQLKLEASLTYHF